jgi:hypothetical protein
MPGPRLAARDRPGWLPERRNVGIEGRRILGKSNERWVLRELEQRGLPRCGKRRSRRDLFGNLSTKTQYLRAGRRTLQVSKFFEGDSCTIFQRFR